MARIPRRGSALAAGYDLYRCAFSVPCDVWMEGRMKSAHDATIIRRGKVLIDTHPMMIPVWTCTSPAPSFLPSGYGSLIVGRRENRTQK